MRQTQTADLQTADLQTCRPADLQTCRLADTFGIHGGTGGGGVIIAHAGIKRQRAKSRGGTLVTRAYIKESTYSCNIQSVWQKKISICLNRGREESVGNNDVMKTENFEETG